MNVSLKDKTHCGLKSREMDHLDFSWWSDAFLEGLLAVQIQKGSSTSECLLTQLFQIHAFIKKIFMDVYQYALQCPKHFSPSLVQMWKLRHRDSHLSKVTQLLRARADIWTQAI